MKNKKGFTLLELLIAATIIGLLVVFATVSYRESVADTRMAAARIKAHTLAAAVQRFTVDYPLRTGQTGQVQDWLSAPGQECHPNLQSTAVFNYCGYIENNGWTDPYVAYYVCQGKTGDCVTSPVDNPLVCLKGLDISKQLDKYNSTKGYIYCISATEEGETLGTSSSGGDPGEPNTGTPGSPAEE